MRQTESREGVGATSGAGVYVPLVLSFYDLWVLGISNPLAWGCPTRNIVAFYDRHASAKHLDVGVGTGYLLDRCTFPSARPRLALVDLNDNSLRRAASRVRRYTPEVKHGDVLLPLDLHGERFDSIGFNYVVHCLPGPMASKACAFGNLAPHLSADGVLFGTTILGRGVHRSAFGRVLMAAYNATGIFGNADDDVEALRAALREHFDEVEINVEGCVAFFVARAARKQ